MSEDWTAIAHEVAVAIGEVGMVCTLRRAAAGPSNPHTGAIISPPTDTAISAVQSMVQIKDAKRTLIGKTVRKLTIAAGVVVPLKSDTIAVNIAPDDVVEATVFHDITDIEPLAPAGVAVKYGIMIAD